MVYLKKNAFEKSANITFPGYPIEKASSIHIWKINNHRDCSSKILVDHYLLVVQVKNKFVQIQ